MRLDRLKTRLNLASIRIKHKAKEHHEKIRGRLKESLPSSGTDFGKSIEQKISSSNKIWSNTSIAAFSTKAIENVSHFSGFLLGTLMLILTDIIVIFPTNRKALDVGSIAGNFLIAFACLFLIEAIAYAAMRAMGSKTSFKVYYSTVNTALFMSILIVALPLALLAFALFSTMLKSDEALNLLFSMIPFYNYLIFGWTTETLSGMKGIKAIVIALIALILILFFMILFPMIRL
jgi:hypothetical protein